MSTKRNAILSPKSTICSCQARRPSRIQDFRDFPESRIEAVIRLLHAPAYTYNNVTHTPRIRLFLFVPPRSQGCLLGGGFDSRRERDVSDRGDKRDESQGCGTSAIISLGLLRKRFVKPKSRKLYHRASLYRLYGRLLFLYITL